MIKSLNFILIVISFLLIPASYSQSESSNEINSLRVDKADLPKLLKAIENSEINVEISEQEIINTEEVDVFEVLKSSKEINSYVSDKKHATSPLGKIKRVLIYENKKSPFVKNKLSAVDSEWNDKIILRSFQLIDKAYEMMGFKRTTHEINGKELFPQIEFSALSSIIYQSNTSTLYVRNTKENLDKIGIILDTIGVLKYSVDDVEQVEIEARFVEVSDGLLKSLGFEWDLDDSQLMQINPFGVDMTVDDGVNGLFNASIINSSSSLPFNQPIALGDGGLPPQSQSPDLLNNRMEDNFNNSLSTMSLSSDRGDSFDLLINQLNQNSEANILSVPRIVTRSGEEATLRVGEIHYFPEVYEGDSSQGTLLNISYEDFDEKFLGIELNVIPRVEDNKITLQLNPSITELNGWQNYQLAPANSIYNHRQLFKRGAYIHDPIIAKLPLFNKRSIETEVVMSDGSTIAMGGLLSEKVIDYKDNIPFLGGIPYVGKIFSSDGKRTIKRNLLVFVTAKIVKPNGQVDVSRTVE